ncbi:GntR family transcriptional regulator, partial [Vibrio vulnificus]
QAVAQMAAEETHGSEEFNQADLQFHSSIWAASHNSLLAVCGQAVAASILNLMNDRLNNADDVGSTMRQAVAKDHAIFNAVEAQDSALAARLSH